MKKSLVLIVAAILMLSLFGCSDKKNADVSGNGGQKLLVVKLVVIQFTE